MVNFKRNHILKYKPNAEESESIALKALLFLAKNQDDCERFFALTGLGLDDVRARAAEPEFLGGVLDYILGDENLLIRFADSEGIPPEVPAMARRSLLKGGDNAEY